MIQYKLILSNRKTIAIYVKAEGEVEVRGPLGLNKAKVDVFVQKKADWIYKTKKRLAEDDKKQDIINLSKEEVEKYKKEAASYFQARCNYFAEKMGVQYQSIKINQAKTRWGSCNSRGNLNFTFRLFFASEDLIDYVIVHELAHLKELNHSYRFWSIVEETMPDYKERRKRLREFGHSLELFVATRGLNNN